MKIFESNNAILHYRSEANSTAAKTLVFINSLGTDFRVWDGVQNALSGPCNIVLHDKQGHGLSALGDTGVSIKTYADDVENLLRHLAVRNIVLVGLSVGGLIAQELMQRKTLDIKAAVLSNTGLKIGTDDMWNSRIASIEAQGLDAISQGVMERWFSAVYRAEQPEMVSLFRTMLSRTPVEGYVACCKALRDAQAFDHSATADKRPVLCIAGSMDGSTPPAVVKALAANFPNSSYYEFEGAGHLPCIEQPERYAKVLSDFVDGT